jgi:hypothetical protein
MSRNFTPRVAGYQEIVIGHSANVYPVNVQMPPMLWLSPSPHGQTNKFR